MANTILSLSVYNDIMDKVRNYAGQYRFLEKKLSAEYGIPMNTVMSLVSNEFTRKMKKNFYIMNSKVSILFGRFKKGLENNESPGIIMRLADEVGVSYTILARALLPLYYKDKEDSVTNIDIKQLIKDPTLIQDRDLAYEVYLCTLYDDRCGNITEITRHVFGEEYELHLQRQLRELNLSFQTEHDLRKFGYDRTPDIKLSVPIAVDGFVVNWIESKALFADPQVHYGYIRDQYSSYWNRFGTGMVVYWLGYVDSIIDPTEKRFLIMKELPKNVIYTNPLSIAKIPEEPTDCQHKVQVEENQPQRPAQEGANTLHNQESLRNGISNIQGLII